MGGNMSRVIVIESEGIHRETVAGIMKNEGFDVTESIDGQSGIAAVRKHDDTTIIFLSDDLPGLPGVDALIAVRKYAPKTPVVMIMDTQNRQNAQMALSRGAAWFIQKPIKVEEVLVVLGNIVEKQRLKEKIDSQVHRLKILEKQTANLTSIPEDELPTEEVLSEDEFLKRSVDLISDVLDAKKVSIMILKQPEEVLIMAHSNWILPSKIPNIRQPISSGVAGQVVKSKKPYLVEDAINDPKVNPNEYSRQYESKSFICTPLFYGKKVIGTISANDKNDKSPFTSGDLALLNTFSHQMSLAIYNKFVMRKVERERLKLIFINEVVNSILASVDPDDIFKSLLDRICAGLGASASVLMVADPKDGNLMVEAIHPRSLGFEDKETFTVGKGVMSKVLKKKEIVIVNDAEKSKDIDKDADLPKGLKVTSMIAAPLIMRGKILGLMTAYNKHDNRPFDHWDRDILSAVSPQASMAIKQAWLYQNLIKSIDEVVETNKQLELANKDIREKVKELNNLKKRALQ